MPPKEKQAVRAVWVPPAMRRLVSGAAEFAFTSTGTDGSGLS